jgi:hypothetical protein
MTGNFIAMTMSDGAESLVRRERLARFRMGGSVAALALAIPLFCGTALAQQAETVTFTVAGQAFEMPMPQGYCLPRTASEISRADLQSSTDPNGVTHVTLDSCGPGASTHDYIIIKTPKSAMSFKTTHDRLLASLGPAFEKETGAVVQTPEEDERLRRIASEQSGHPVDVSTAIEPRGHDDVCAYLGGTAQITDKRPRYETIGGCIAVVSGRVLMIVLAADGNDPATLARLLPRSRAMALAIVSK